VIIFEKLLVGTRNEIISYLKNGYLSKIRKASDDMTLSWDIDFDNLNDSKLSLEEQVAKIKPDSYGKVLFWDYEKSDVLKSKECDNVAITFTLKYYHIFIKNGLNESELESLEYN
jgi:hypothetical protein